MTNSKEALSRPPEGTAGELFWLRGFEAGVNQMRQEKPMNMLADLYQRHVEAARKENEQERKRFFDLIEEFEWAFPEAATAFHSRYGRLEQNETKT